MGLLQNPILLNVLLPNLLHTSYFYKHRLAIIAECLLFLRVGLVICFLLAPKMKGRRD